MMQESVLSGQVLKNALDALYDGIAIFDFEGRPCYVNDAHLTQIGATREEWFRLSANEISQVSPPLASRAVSGRVIQEKRAVSDTVQYYRTGKTCLVSGVPIISNTGEFFCVAIVRDLTELLDLQKKVQDMDAIKTGYLKQIEELQNSSHIDQDVNVKSESMEKLYEKATKIADMDVSVLILGETGVGKDFLAQYIHKKSSRTGPYVKVNCNAIPPNLLESELFGYSSGAFTGANKHGKIGLIEMANTGTLFLDEIGDISLDLQVKLLGVLQDKTFTRLGDVKPIKSDFRIIAATNANLEEKIEEGTFRQDLYYRLNVINFRIPPLRERHEDIIFLAYRFLNEFCEKYDKTIEFGKDCAEVLINYTWPGNIRELRNTVERLVVLETDQALTKETVAQNLIHPELVKSSFDSVSMQSVDLSRGLKGALDNFEKLLLSDALNRNKTLAQTARALDIDLSTLVRKKKKFHL